MDTVWFHSHGTSDVVKIIETERKSTITKGSGEDLLFKRYSFSFATWKSSGDLQQNNGNILDTTEQYSKKGYGGKFNVIFFFATMKKKERKKW